MARKTDIPASPSETTYVSDEHYEDALPEEGDPFDLFALWLAEAGKKEVNDPNAMTLATADDDGLPDARMVLLKSVDEAGFVFFSSLQSAKGGQIAANPRAALLFHWKSLRRQVRVRGGLTTVSDTEADAYFATRARSSQIGAWASKQSRPIEGPLAIEKAVAEAGLHFGLGAVPRPHYWTGFRLSPTAIEFWRTGRFRLHHRLKFQRETTDAPWRTSRLYP